MKMVMTMTMMIMRMMMMVMKRMMMMMMMMRRMVQWDCSRCGLQRIAIIHTAHEMHTASGRERRDT